MQDPYYKKSIKFRYEGNSLEFKISQSLFSSQNIDHGTQRLLRTLTVDQINQTKKILDLGCGYGPIGLTLKKVNPSAEVHLVDIDALALKYTKDNAKLNSLENCIKIYASLGYVNVEDKDFDLIVSNTPAKVGKKVLTHIILDVKQHLTKSGFVAIVVIDAILEEVKDILNSDSNINIIFQKSWPGHTIFHYRFNLKSDISNLDQTDIDNLYIREQKEMYLNKKKIIITTTYNLSEFDTLNYETELLLKKLKFIKNKQFPSVVVYNPNQGYLPVGLIKQANIKQLILIDRNLQAIVTSTGNLINNHYPKEQIISYHQVGISIEDLQKCDLFISALPDKDPTAAYTMYLDQISNILKPGGQIMLSASSTTITRMEDCAKKNKLFSIIERARYKGRSYISMRLK